MTEGPTQRGGIERFFRKRVADIVVAVVALFVSIVSLWIGVRTENANEQLVAASSWPFLQIQVDNADPDAKLDLQFRVANAGVGPAKVESFEVFWKGVPFRTADELLGRCCGYKVVLATSPEAKNHTPLIIGTVQGVVLRAGDTATFIHYRLNADNFTVWTALDKARDQMTYRICYCSVLDECWRTDTQSERALPARLHPEQVSKCPAPVVPYTE